MDLGPIAVFGFIAFLFWLGFRKQQDERTRVMEVQKQLLDKLGSGPELTQFLASDEGKQFFNLLKDQEKPRKQRELDWVGGTMTWGLVSTFVGVGFFVAARLAVQSALVIPGAICVGAGIALLIASGLSYRLSKKWGLIQKPGDAPGSRAS